MKIVQLNLLLLSLASLASSAPISSNLEKRSLSSIFKSFDSSAAALRAATSVPTVRPGLVRQAGNLDVLKNIGPPTGPRQADFTLGAESVSRNPRKPFRSKLTLKHRRQPRKTAYQLPEFRPTLQTINEKPFRKIQRFVDEGENLAPPSRLNGVVDVARP